MGQLILHFSPISRQKILNVWEELGVKIEGIEFPTYKIPIEDLKKENLIYFDPQVYQRGNFEFSEKQIRKFCPDSYSELNSVTDEQVELWKKDQEEGRRLFWYSHTTHVLYKGSVKISDYEIIICK